jgi:ribose-phosphate pyrophosphokinase
VIYDDMIRTGSSLLSAARAYLDAGASSVAAVASHGVFPGNALERIAASGLLTHIFVSDSHPRARELAHPMLTVQSVAPVFAGFLRN